MGCVGIVLTRIFGIFRWGFYRDLKKIGMIGLDYTGLILKKIEDFPNAILNLTVVWNQVQNNPIQ